MRFYGNLHLMKKIIIRQLNEYKMNGNGLEVKGNLLKMMQLANRSQWARKGAGDEFGRATPITCGSTLILCTYCGLCGN